MPHLWTKNGQALAFQGNAIVSPSGALVGRIRGDRVFRDDGGYVGTLVGDRLIYRSHDIDGPSRAYTRRVSPTEVASVQPARTWGDEPIITDAPMLSSGRGESRFD
jgi:hypothetical protein